MKDLLDINLDIIKHYKELLMTFINLTNLDSKVNFFLNLKVITNLF